MHNLTLPNTGLRIRLAMLSYHMAVSGPEKLEVPLGFHYLSALVRNFGDVLFYK
jgi:hypothetical protein